MKRAKQTAEIINEGRDIPIITDERIRERKLGEQLNYIVLNSTKVITSQ